MRRTKTFLTGFVCFMNRVDADRAIKEYDGYEWDRSMLRVSWSKAVPIPRRAIYGGFFAPSPRPVLTSDLPREPSRHDAPGNRHRSRSRSPPAKRRRSASPHASAAATRKLWLDRVSDDDVAFIRDVAERILRLGRGFESTLREQQQENPKFKFMFNRDVRPFETSTRR